MLLVEEEVVQPKQVRRLEALQLVEIAQYANLVQRLLQKQIAVLDDLRLIQRV